MNSLITDLTTVWQLWKPGTVNLLSILVDDGKPVSVFAGRFEKIHPKAYNAYSVHTTIAGIRSLCTASCYILGVLLA